MVNNNTLMDFGFIKDENNLKLKELHVDVYPYNPLSAASPFMLLLRMGERNVMVESDGSRVILKRDDKYNTYITNVLFSKITECFLKVSEDCSEFIVKIQNTYYRIIVFK